LRAFDLLRRGGAKSRAWMLGAAYAGLAGLLVLGMIGSYVSQQRL
jgi:ABC-type branched-subunit amino acid transport system permease subunit